MVNTLTKKKEIEEKNQCTCSVIEDQTTVDAILYTSSKHFTKKANNFLIYCITSWRKKNIYMTTCLVQGCWECPCNWQWWRMWPRPSDLARGSRSPWPRPEPSLPKKTINLSRLVCHLKRWPPDRWLWTSTEGRTSARLAGCWTGSPLALAPGSSLPPRP